MLSADQIGALRDVAGELMDPVVEYLISDIADRVKTAGQLTGTAAYKTWILQTMGVGQKKLKKELAKRLGLTREEIGRLMKQAAQVGYDFDISRFPTAGAIPFEKNTSIQQIVAAAVEMAGEELDNLTRTMGFVGYDGKADGLTDAYRKACDFAFTKTVTGAQDYNSAIREAVKGLAEKGILTIDYKSGTHRSIEVAVRDSVMGALGLMDEKICQQNHDDLGCDGWEISAHHASAPDHEPFQGKQYPDAQYKRLNGSLRRRIGTLGCGHSAMGVIVGVMEPQYTDEELEEMRQENEKGVDYEGKHYTGYQATQRQRTLERKIRKQKKNILLDEKLEDEEKLQTDRIRYQVLNQEYRRFSKATGQKLRHERLEAVGFGPKQANAAARAAKEQPREKIAHPNNTPDKVVPSQNYTEITGQWYPDAEPNSHPVRDLDEYVVDGVTYKVDGRNVQLDYKPHEKEIAEFLAREIGGEIYMVPRVNNPQGVSTPDYIFNGKAYDLKTLSKDATENTIFNRVKKARKQAHNFIIDVSHTMLSDEVIEAQIRKLYENNSTVFVDEVVIIRDGVIVRVVKRKKGADTPPHLRR